MGKNFELNHFTKTGCQSHVCSITYILFKLNCYSLLWVTEKVLGIPNLYFFSIYMVMFQLWGAKVTKSRNLAEHGTMNSWYGIVTRCAELPSWLGKIGNWLYHSLKHVDYVQWKVTCETTYNMYNIGVWMRWNHVTWIHFLCYVYSADISSVIINGHYFLPTMY